MTYPQTQPSTMTEPNPTGPINGEAIMRLIFQLLLHAFTHTHTFERWKESGVEFIP